MTGMTSKIKRIIVIEKTFFSIKELLSLLIMFWIKTLLDGNHSTYTFLNISAINVVLLAVSTCVHMLCQWIRAIRIRVFAKTRKEELAEVILSASPSNLLLYTTEQLISFIENDTETILQDYLEKSIDKSSLYIKLIACLFILWIIDFKLMIAMILLVGFNKIIARFLNTDLRSFMVKRQEAKEEYYHILGNYFECRNLFRDDNVDSILHRFHQKPMNTLIDSKYNFGQKKSAILLRFNVLLNIQKVLGILVLLLLVRRQEIAIGTALLFYNYLEMLTHLMSDLSAITTCMKATDAIVRKQHDFLNMARPAIINNQIFNMELIEGKVKYLDSIMNYTFQRGDCILITGPTGCGKSTLLKVLSQMIALDEGSYRINDVKIDSILQSYENEIEYMSQLDIEHLEIIAKRIGMQRKQMELLNEKYQLKLDLEATQKHVDLSTGEKQKLCILYHVTSPCSVKLYDEPFSNLDSYSIEKYCAMVCIENREGITIVISHHNTDEIRNYFTEMIEL